MGQIGGENNVVDLNLAIRLNGSEQEKVITGQNNKIQPYSQKKHFKCTFKRTF